MALYAIAVVMSTLMVLPEGHFMADASGHLAVGWGFLILGVITLLYTVMGGFFGSFDDRCHSVRCAYYGGYLYDTALDKCAGRTR